MGCLTLRTQIERWPLVAPFRITGYTWEAVDVLVVSLGIDGHVGCGEAHGVYYRNDNPASMIKQIESLRTTIEAGIDRESLQSMLPPGGARNALDCALWDLEAKLSGRPAWQVAEVASPRPLLTTFTCGADEPETMAAAARAYTHARAIKLKLTGEPIDVERILAVREAKADVWLGVDANQGFTRPFLERLMPTRTASRVALIERPFLIANESLSAEFHCSIPVPPTEQLHSTS